MTHLNPIISVNPIVFQVPNRQVDLEIKVTAPLDGENHPVIIFSHGHGASNFLSSYRGYAPLADFFASRGCVFIQPTHLNSKALALDPTGPEGPLFWKSRPKDMKFILDNLDEIISSVPSLSGRVNTENVAAIGHSLGGITVAMLAGMEITDPVTGKIENFAESRLKARVMIGVTGSPEGLTGQIARNNFPFLLGINFETMTLPALVVNGDKDKNLAFSDVDNWRADAYYDSPTPKSLLTIFGAEHIFGGISGYDALETSDENPERVAFVCSSIMMYLKDVFNPNDTSWEDLKKELNGITDAKGRIDSK